MRMRILVLTSQLPSLDTGGAIRLLHLLRHLSKVHDMTAWAVDFDGQSPAQAQALLPRCSFQVQYVRPLQSRNMERDQAASALHRRTQQVKHSLLERRAQKLLWGYFPELQPALDELLESGRYDLVHVENVFMWPYVSHRVDLHRLLCCSDSWTTISERQYRVAPPTGWPQRLWERLEIANVRRFEGQAASAANRCVVVSETDKDRFLGLAPTAAIDVVSNGVDTEYFTPAQQEPNEPTILFMGTLSWPPNIDGLAYFCQKVMPLIQARMPDVRFIIVGRNPAPEVLALEKGREIQVIGAVPDVRPYLAQAAVCVVPLRVGSGSRLKILEALAAGRAVVSTTIGAEGLDVAHRRDLLIADDPEMFANSVCELLHNRSLRAQLAANGRALVEERYDWQALAGKLDRIYREAAGVN